LTDASAVGFRQRFVAGKTTSPGLPPDPPTTASFSRNAKDKGPAQLLLVRGQFESNDMSKITHKPVGPQTKKSTSGDGDDTQRPLVDRKEFLETVFGQLNEGEFVCLTEQKPRSDGEGVWFNSYLESDRAWRKWKEDEQARAVYHCVSTVDGEMNEKGTMISRKRSNLVRAHTFVLDDIGTKTGEPPVEPSYKLESSPGNEQWGYLLAPTDELAKYEALIAAVHDLGWGDGGAGGSYRVMRTPGSANMKPGNDNFRSRVTYWEPEREWTLEELADAFGLDLAALPVKAGKKQKARLTGESIDPMLNWLSDNGLVVEDDGGDFVDIVCPWHDQHTDGSVLASYSPLGRGGSYEYNRSYSCFHEHCKSRDTNDLLSWASDRNGPNVEKYDPLPVIQANYILVERGPMVVDLRERRAGREALRDLTEFSTANYRKVSVPWREKPVLVKTAFLEDFQTVKAKGLTYQPTTKDTPLISASDGALLVNMYMPPQWKETDSVPDVLIEHLDYLLPDKIEREYFWGWLAHKIQNPAERGVAIVMIAEDAYGIGRSWLGSLLDKVLPGEVRQTDIKQLTGGNGGGASTYNDLYANKQIVVVDETQADDPKVQFKAYENLKLVVDTSPSRCRVNPKYGKVYEVELLFNLLAFSNNADALHIPADDRRFCVLTNPTGPLSSEYYSQLYAQLEDTRFLAAVYWYLRRYDWSAINPRKLLKTRARDKMIEVTKSPRDQVIDAMYENTLVPDFMTRVQLRLQVDAAMSKLSLSARSSEATAANVERHLWAQMVDAPWKAEDDDTRFRPRIDGQPTHIKAWNWNADWPPKDADWGKIVVQPSRILSQLVGQKPGQKSR
jgi:hypothetical protein